MPTGPRPAPGPRIVRIGVTGTQGGLPWAWVFWCQTDEPGIDSNAGAKDFADAFRSKLNASGLMAALHTSVSVTQIRAVIQLDADTAVTGVNTATLSGGSGGSVEPASCAVVASWQSAAFWRGGKPRTYLPGVPTSEVDTNHSLLDSVKATIAGLLETFRTDVNAITTPAVDSTALGFVSFASGKEWRATPVFFPFTGVSVHDRLGTQRRRLGPWLP